MKILFISSGNQGHINPLINAQKESLLNTDSQIIEIDTYLIKGQRLTGYLGNILPLRKFIKRGKYDCIHAHYSFSGIVASLAGGKTIITSLMGSDVNKNKLYKFVAKLFVQFIWDHTIVKSNDMAEHFSTKKISIIPNGVDTSRFKPFNRFQACNSLGWDSSKTHILFAASPSRPEKNYKLAEAAHYIASKKHPNLEMHALNNVPHEEMPTYFNASDVILLSSKWEGSPNVIKEAMACNKPIVCTNVGDVKWLFGKVPGHFISNFDVADVSNKILSAIDFSKTNRSTEGRERLIKLNLDSNIISKKIIKIYEEVIS